MTVKCYTASVISMRNCPATGHWDLFLYDPLPQRETLADAIRQSFMPLSVMVEHLKQNAVPTLIEIRSQDGLIALADVVLERKPFRMSVLWREELSAGEAPGIEKSRAFNLTKSKKVLYDVLDAAEAEGGAITVKLLDLFLESKSYAEPVRDTMKLVYEVEREMGLQANRVHRLESELGM